MEGLEKIWSSVTYITPEINVGTKMYTHQDEKAFVNCQKILNGIPTDEENPVIQNADRGVVVLHVDMND
mgnify:CR=1 FL=1